jgi:hypothetical protein
VPVGAARRGRRAGGKSEKKKFRSLIFNPQAGRPCRTSSTPVSDTITLDLSAVYTLFTTSTSVPVYAGRAFVLSDFANYAALTAVFDEYKINQIEAWLEPSIIDSASTGACQWVSSIDIDDANVPTAGSQVIGHQGSQISLSGTAHYHKWVPHYATAAYSGAFTSYGNNSPNWIDCASPSVQHFGLKTATLGADGQTRLMYLTIRASVSFRGATI